MGSDGRSVILTTGTLTSGTQYTVTVSGVTDTAAIPNTILAGSQVSFIALPLAPATIGNGSGQVVSAGGGFDVTGSGGAVGGTADQFQFAYEKRTNNFDVRVRVAKLSIPDAFVQGGLMARVSNWGMRLFKPVALDAPPQVADDPGDVESGSPFRGMLHQHRLAQARLAADDEHAAAARARIVEEPVQRHAFAGAAPERRGARDRGHDGEPTDQGLTRARRSPDRGIVLATKRRTARSPP